MNQQTIAFLAELKARPEVVGVILFGSWARGNQRPDSDVDLVVILSTGYRRAVEYRDQQAFEIIYTTAASALDYWQTHKDDAAGLWAVAKILYDRDGTIEQLRAEITAALAAGKPPIDEFQLKQYRFDAEDQLRYIEAILSSDSTTANLLLTNKVFQLTELFFELRQLWIPAPKQRLAEIESVSPEFAELLREFYREDVSTSERLMLTKSMIPIIFLNG